MKNTVKNVLVISMVTLSLSVAGIASAKGHRLMGNDNMNQRGGGDPREQFGRGGLRQLASELNLTAEQKQQIMTIVMKNRLDRMQDRQDVQPPFQKMFDMLLNEDFDEAKVREMVQQQMAEREQMREDRFVERAKMVSEIKAVLTPEQLEQAKQLGTDFFQGNRWDNQKPGAQQNARGRGHRQDRHGEHGWAQNEQGMRGKMSERGRDFGKGGAFQGGGLPFMMLADLNLSEDQKQQAAEIFAKQKVNAIEQRQDFRAPGGQMAKTLLEEDFDEQKLRELYKQQANAEQNPAQQMEEHIVGMAKTFAEFKALLTPEQLDTLKQNVAEWTENAGQHGGKFGPQHSMRGGRF